MYEPRSQENKPILHALDKKKYIGLSQKRLKIKWREQLAAYIFLLPGLILFILFSWYPIISSFIMSFQDVKLAGESTWVGFENYAAAFRDPLLALSWKNSLQFALLSIVMGFALPVTTALLVNEVRRFKWFFRLAYFMPSLIPTVIYVLVWRLIYAPEGGFINTLLHQFGFAPHLWLQDTSTVKPAMIIILTWANFGGTMLIYLAALQDVSSELYEAAEIDGANPLRRMYYITLPYLLNTFKFLMIAQILGVAQLFAEPFLLTNGGPANSTLTPVISIYRKAFFDNDFGVASSWSVLLIIVLAAFSAIYLYATRKSSEY